MKQSLSQVRSIFATYVAAKLAKGKSTEGSLSEPIVAKYGLSRAMRNAVN